MVRLQHCRWCSGHAAFMCLHQLRLQYPSPLSSDQLALTATLSCCYYLDGVYNDGQFHRLCRMWQEARAVVAMQGGGHVDPMRPQTLIGLSQKGRPVPSYPMSDFNPSLRTCLLHLACNIYVIKNTGTITAPTTPAGSPLAVPGLATAALHKPLTFALLV